MNRTLIAGLFALAALPATVFSADAAVETGFTRTVGIGCRLNANDGESLKVRMMVMNTSGYHLPQGSKVRIGLRYRVGGTHPRFGRTITRYVEQTLWRDVPAKSGIGFDQPRWLHKEPFSCAASVTFASKVKLDQTLPSRKIGKLPR